MMRRMPQSIGSILRGDKQRRGWTYREAAPKLKTTPQTVQKWTASDVIPERYRAPELADFLDLREQEILTAMDEAERERRAREDLRDQVDIMREEQRQMNAELLDLREEVAALLAEVRRTRPQNGNGKT